MSLNEMSVHRQSSGDRKAQRMQAHKREMLHRRPKKQTIAQKMAVKKMKSTGMYSKIASLRQSLDLPSTLTEGRYGHRREFIDLVLTEAAEADLDWNAKDFAKHFLSKDSAYSNTDTGLAALQFETWLVENDDNLFQQFIETQITATDPKFLAIFSGKLKDADRERLEQGIQEFCGVKVLVNGGDVHYSDGLVSDMCILECSVKKKVNPLKQDDQKQPSIQTGQPKFEGMDPAYYTQAIEEGGIRTPVLKRIIGEDHVENAVRNGRDLVAMDGNNVAWMFQSETKRWTPVMDEQTLDRVDTVSMTTGKTRCLNCGAERDCPECEGVTEIAECGDCQLEEGTVANTIKDQLGGKALFMMGAKNLVALSGDSGLGFRIGRNASGANYVEIKLNSMDTYDVAFKSIRGTKVTTKKEINGVYADQLHKILQDTTGMALSLTKRYEVAEGEDEAVLKALTTKPESLFKLAVKVKGANLSTAQINTKLMRLELQGKVKQFAPDPKDKDLGSPLNTRWALKEDLDESAQKSLEILAKDYQAYKTERIGRTAFAAYFRDEEQADQFAKAAHREYPQARMKMSQRGSNYMLGIDHLPTDEGGPDDPDGLPVNEGQETALEISLDKRTNVWVGGRTRFMGTVDKAVEFIKGQNVAPPYRIYWTNEYSNKKAMQKRSEQIAQGLGLTIGEFKQRQVGGYEHPGLEAMIESRTQNESLTESQFKTWRAVQDPEDQDRTIIEVGGKVYSIDYALADVQATIQQIREFYDDLPDEADAAIEQYFIEFCVDEGAELCNENVVSMGLKLLSEEAGGSEIYGRDGRDNRIALRGRLRLEALGQATDDTVSIEERASDLAKNKKRDRAKRMDGTIGESFKKGDKVVVKIGRKGEGKDAAYKNNMALPVKPGAKVKVFFVKSDGSMGDHDGYKAGKYNAIIGDAKWGWSVYHIPTASHYGLGKGKLKDARAFVDAIEAKYGDQLNSRDPNTVARLPGLLDDVKAYKADGTLPTGKAEKPAMPQEEPPEFSSPEADPEKLPPMAKQVALLKTEFESGTAIKTHRKASTTETGKALKKLKAEFAPGLQLQNRKGTIFTMLGVYAVSKGKQGGIVWVFRNEKTHKLDWEDDDDVAEMLVDKQLRLTDTSESLCESLFLFEADHPFA